MWDVQVVRDSEEEWGRFVISREELHQLAWSEPMTKIAERFEVSSSYLARIYTMLNVPRPERGYWQKLAVGKAPPTVPLPAARPGDELSIGVQTGPPIGAQKGPP
ncbi:MAG: hypothetical protein V4618_09080, partial [Pseudomonadota bacterium]